MTEIFGVVKLNPLPSKPPPVEVSYQSTVVPEGLEAKIVSAPGPHLWSPESEAASGVTKLTVATTAVLESEIHPVAIFLVSE